MMTTSCGERRPAARGGFTLIELLVSLAIIALLLGVLLPALGNVRGGARLIQCASHQRQVGQALGAYAVDFDSQLPATHGEAAVTPSLFYKPVSGYDLRPAVASYVRDFRVWNCVSTQDAAPLDDPGNTRAAGCYGTYMYFPGHPLPVFGFTGPMPTSIDDRRISASLTLLQDRYRDFESPGLAPLIYNHGEGTRHAPAAGNPSYGGTYGDEGQGINSLFFDGHAAWTPARELSFIGLAQTGPNLRAFGVLP
jgi:prepilin-type N-terminal cleavage/methylation domain-containing protein/prepilin-type processing-associated H-X9-DG protein